MKVYSKQHEAGTQKRPGRCVIKVIAPLKESKKSAAYMPINRQEGSSQLCMHVVEADHQYNFYESNAIV